MTSPVPTQQTQRSTPSSVLVLRVWVATLATLATAVVIGVPTDLLDTHWFTRMTPILWWNYPVWILSSVLSGLIAATYVRSGPSLPQREGQTLFATFLSVFAVGCPVCNKLVVLLLGVTGALTWFAPLQPYLAAGSIALLVYALRSRTKAMRVCRLPPNRQ